MVGAQGLIEEVHSVGQGHGGLRTPQLRRVPQGVGEGIRGAGAGEQGLGVVLSGRRAQLLHEIEGLATAAGIVPNWDGVDVHRPQEPGGCLLDPPPALGLGPPFLPDHAALKPVDHHLGAVLREPADRGLDEFAQRPTGVSGRPIPSQPARGDARGREHRENPELNASDRLPVGALLLDPLERALEGQPQGDAHGLGVLIPLPAPNALLQRCPLEHVEIGRQSVPVTPRRRRGLHDRDRKIAQGPGDGVRRPDVRRPAVGPAARAVEQNADRLLPLEDPDGHVRPACAFPVRQPRRGHQDPQTRPSGNKGFQVIGAVDVVEHDEATRLLRRGQFIQTAPRDHLAGGAVLDADAELQPQLDETGEDRLVRTRGDPGHERPTLLFAAGRHGGGQLRLPAATHAREHRAPRRPGEDRPEQPLLLQPPDEPGHLHGTTAQPNTRGASRHGPGKCLFDLRNIFDDVFLANFNICNYFRESLDAIEQLPEGTDLEVLRPRRQEHELLSDGPHERVEEGLGRRLHIPAVLLNPPADDLPEAVGLPHGGHDDDVVPRQLFEEDLDLGHRAPQQAGVNVLLLAPAPSIRDLGLQARGDPLAEGVDRPPSPFESGDVAPTRARRPDHRRHAAG